MKKNAAFLATFAALILNCTILIAQEYYSLEGNKLILDNGFIKRQIVINRETNSITTDQLYLKGFSQNFCAGTTEEFGFLVNDKLFSGRKDWKIVDVSPVSDSHAGRGAAVKLETVNKEDGIEVVLNYLMYPGLPVIRKYITFRNTGLKDMKIEGLDIEKLSVSLRYVESWIYTGYGRMKDIGSYLGNWNDALVIVHHPGSHAGIALGNEVPGVIKRTQYSNDRVTIGLTHPEQDYPFRKWLKPGEIWTSPRVFIALYNNTDNGEDAMNGVVNEFTRRHIGYRLNEIRNKPVFVYNTWYPFRTFINDSLIRSVARSAAECGIQEFILDDGWQVNYHLESSKKGWGNNYGDWLIDRNKFPYDLKSTFDYIRSLGMKPGLWMSIGSATNDSRVFKEHPDWFVRGINGHLGNVYSHDTLTFHSACFGTGWFDYIKETILKLVREHGLAYAKLDFSVATSAYVYDPAISGCYATDHPWHRDHQESFIAIYERLLKLFDELHQEAPDLFIDCTYETTGKMNFQDYAFAQHAEGNWLSNIEDPSPTGALRVRQLAWWRSPAMPAGSLVIGNLPFDSRNFDLDLKSLIGTLPIILGDPTKLSDEQKDQIKKWSDWLIRMQEKFNFMTFRQDLPGFGEPAEGYWDGWARINTETKQGGIVGIFRQGAVENTRAVAVKGLEENKMYVVKSAPGNTEIVRMSGADLIKTGFTVKIEDKYDGRIFEIELLHP